MRHMCHQELSALFGSAQPLLPLTSITSFVVSSFQNAREGKKRVAPNRSGCIFVSFPLQSSYGTLVLMIRFALVLVILVRGVVAAEQPGFVSLFNGRNLEGWINVNCAPETWSVRDGVIHCTGKPTGALRTPRQYENFVIELEWRGTSEPWRQFRDLYLVHAARRAGSSFLAKCGGASAREWLRRFGQGPMVHNAR